MPPLRAGDGEAPTSPLPPQSARPPPPLPPEPAAHPHFAAPGKWDRSATVRRLGCLSPRWGCAPVRARGVLGTYGRQLQPVRDSPQSFKLRALGCTTSVRKRIVRLHARAGNELGLAEHGRRRDVRIRARRLHGLDSGKLRVAVDSRRCGPMRVGNPGCMFAKALNYDSTSTIDDGASCIFERRGCMDSTSANFDSRANAAGSCVGSKELGMNPAAVNLTHGATLHDASCIYKRRGCLNSTARTATRSPRWMRRACMVCRSEGASGQAPPTMIRPPPPAPTTARLPCGGAWTRTP